MPRLPEELIARIKKEVDLVKLIQSQGYQLKKNGKDYLLSCPWHDDVEPSLVVSPDTNLWHCMGACQTGGRDTSYGHPLIEILIFKENIDQYPVTHETPLKYQ